MNLNQQVTSLDISKRLKELGVKQEGIFYWERPVDGRTGWHLGFDAKGREHTNTYKSFTVAELGEMLPEQVNIPFANGRKRAHDHSMYTRKCRNFSQGLWAVTYSHYRHKEVYTQFADTEADARGKMLIYLMENNLISV